MESYVPLGASMPHAPRRPGLGVLGMLNPPGDARRPPDAARIARTPSDDADALLGGAAAPGPCEDDEDDASDEEDTTTNAQLWGSLNYDEFVNDAAIDAARKWKPKRRRAFFGYSGRTLARWVVTCAIGLTMGATAITLSKLTESLLLLRVSFLAPLSDAPTVRFAAYVLWNSSLAAAAAALVVFVAPGAAGSGIPVVKAYLNGVRPATQSCLSLRCFGVKLVGTALAVASGASLGPEGPLVHLGAIVGSFFTGGLDPTKFCVALQKDRRKRRQEEPPQFFRSDVDRRDFLSLGAACGFSAAFGAPIGGTLFALEEASSFFSNELLLRSLVGTALATFAALALAHGIVHLRVLSHYGLISLSGSDEAEADVPLALVPASVLIGVVGGCAGAAFNILWYKCERLRQAAMKRLERSGASMFHRQLVRVAEATFGVCLTSLAFYGAAVVSRSWACVDRGGDGWTSDAAFSVRFDCPHGQVHELASLWFHGNTREEAILKILEAPPGAFSASALFLSGFLTLLTLVISFGATLPGGLFLPLIFCGSCFGGAASRCHWLGLPALLSEGALGHVAILGAVALLAGVQRSTVSLVVIILEGTGNAALLIPIIITTVAARSVGGLFVPGLYELSLDLRATPFLEKHVKQHLYERTVADLLCDQALVTLASRPTVADALAQLGRCDHGAFPVVVGGGEGANGERSHQKLLGLVLREHVRALIRHRYFVETDAPRTGPSAALSHRIAMAAWDAGRVRNQNADGTRAASRISRDASFASVGGDELWAGAEAPEDALPCAPVSRGPGVGAFHLDLEYVMVRSPHVVYADCPVSRAYRLFVTMGLRHLLVVDHQGDVVGMLTRRDWLKTEN
ncbi:chloride channel [Pelagophyceae sp. CCMP2097]|nr:chloride channel [Pelagophyceae sp. CCMP2097]